MFSKHKKKKKKVRISKPKFTLKGNSSGRVHERVRNAESREGASFGKLFGPAISLGIVSRRRVHYEAIEYEKERNGGFLSPFGYSTISAAAAIDAVNSMEVLVFTAAFIYDA